MEHDCGQILTTLQGGSISADAQELAPCDSLQVNAHTCHTFHISIQVGVHTL